ncbi:MAG TPA: VCBS repeat-containing protein [Candidatus Babeliales bacterium]|nr:VCBS repeat-containing protein [Candidatus Babeliales bacterium]
MKTTHRLTLIALTTLFVIAIAVMCASTPAEVSAQSRSAFSFAPRSLTGLASPAGPLGFVQGLFQAPWRGFDTGIFGQGFGPGSIAFGDIDGDGDVDILVGNSFFGSPGISVLKNNGDQTFAAPVYYATPLNEVVGEVALSDFDSDGDLDAFATIRGDFDQMTKIKVWRNNGNGTFGSPVEFATGQGPVGIVIADFTGDNKPDVVTANYGGSSISILRHNGLTGNSAGFLAPVSFSTANRAEKIAAADVNGDTILDVVVGGQVGSGFAASLAVMINSGNGVFATPVPYDAAPGGRFGSTAVALADLDNDGDADLIGGGDYENGSVDSGAITIRRNNGNGTFGSAEIILFDAFVPMPKELTTGRINSDGLPDIVAAVPSGRIPEGFVTVTSNGSGGFNTPVYYEASQQTFDAGIIDLDNDGDGDVVTLANSSAAVTVHENHGDGSFPVLTRYEVASLSDAVQSADIDNDGDIDIVVNGEVDIASNDAVVKILKNNGNGTFAPAIDYTPSRNFADMKLRDINGDHFVDLIFGPDGNYPSFHFGTALNNGNGTFAPTVVTQVFSCGSGTIDAADLDGDGDLDIVLTEEETCPGNNAHIFVFRNDGNQNFVRMPDINLPGRLPHGLALAEVTGDTNIDIITALPDGMGVFPGNGNLTFGAPIISTTAPYKFKVVDFNHDGLLDLGMIMQQDSFGTELIGTALGNGNGTFQAVQTQTGSSVLENLRISDDLHAGDVDGDGTPDLVVLNYASNDVSVFLVNSDGSLRPDQRYGIGNTPQLGTMADFDGDGRMDVAAAIGLPPSGLHNAIVLLRNVSSGPQPTPTPTPTATGTPPSPTPTPTATATPTATPTATATVTPTVTPSPTPTVTPSSTPRPTPTARPRITPRPRSTPVPRP